MAGPTGNWACVVIGQSGQRHLWEALWVEHNGAAAEVAFLNLGYFDATRFYWDPWAQKKLTASLY